MTEKLSQFADGNFSRAAFLYIAKMMVNNDPQLMKKAAEVADICGAFTGERCDQAFDFTKCLHDKVKSEKLDVHILR